MEQKLLDTELKVLELLWRRGDTTAKELAQLLREQVGWSKTTTYTVLKRCIDKGIIQRGETDFICKALITRDEARSYETSELINRMYDGAADQLVASLLSPKRLTKEEISHLKKLISELE